MNNKIKAGIAGGAGYTGGELLRILINHPNVELHFVQSRSHAGHPFETVHEDLAGEDAGIFVEKPIAGTDVVFLCMGHGASVKYLEETSFDDNTRIIDLSQDFRLKRESNDFVYGLPELNKDQIKKADRVANPGCFATCIILGLLPLAAGGFLNEEVHTSGVTGSTGAGQSLTPTSHFSWRNNNLSVYKAFEHQHLHEIKQSLQELQQDFKGDLHFIPFRGNFPRGIMVTSYLKCSLSEGEVYELFEDFYKDHPFTFVSKKNPHLKQVVNTNKAIVHLAKHGDQLMVISAIDNLLKGASGQAVQNMNLMFGYEERLGLNLKASAF
jgi:N-acetyl-gamma-glutamyl-phosphate reductase